MSQATPFRILRTEAFDTWYDRLRDRRAKTIITARIVRLEQGLRGDTRVIGKGLAELRIDYGPGYRLYYIEHGRDLVVLLCGGDKSSQVRDIQKAQELAREMRDGP